MSIRESVSRAIIIQSVLVAAVGLVVLVLALLRVVDGSLGLGWAFGGLLGGLVVGIVASRSKRIEWDDSGSRVTSRMDWIGAMILLGFILAQITRRWLLGHWAEGVALTTLGLCVSAGTLLGQVLGIRRRVRNIRKVHDQDAGGRPRRP